MTTFPHLHLLVSGGNSQIIWVERWQNWQIVGQTQDDAAGECLDKIGRMLGLDYPGGVWVSRVAGLVDQNLLNFPISEIKNSNLAKVSNSNLSNSSSNSNSNSQGLVLSSKISTLKNGKIPKTRRQNSFLQNPSLSQKLEINANLLENSAEKSSQNLSKINSAEISAEITQNSKHKNYNFSFSGLKTAVRYFLAKQNLENWKIEQKLTKLEVEILLNWQIITDFLNWEKNTNLSLEIVLEKKQVEIVNNLEKENQKSQNEQKNKESIAKISELIDRILAKNLIQIENQKDFSSFAIILKSQDLTKLELFWKVCVSAQSAVIEQLTRRFERAILDLKPISLGLSGGVSANLLLRQKMQNLTDKFGLEKLYRPHLALTGDNAVMIALAGIADLWSEKDFNV